MPAFVFTDHPIEDLIRKNLNMAGVLIRVAKNQAWSTGAAVAIANARQACDRARELIRTLPPDEQSAWHAELTALQNVINIVDCR